jgi:hypothetical protein
VQDQGGAGGAEAGQVLARRHRGGPAEESLPLPSTSVERESSIDRIEAIDPRPSSTQPSPSPDESSPRKTIEPISISAEDIRRPGILLESKIKKFRATLLEFPWPILFFIITVCISFLSSASVPSFILFSDPSRTIFAVNATSALSTALLGSIVADVLQELRWSLAARPRGVRMVTFLGLGKAVGVWRTLRSLKKEGGGHRSWCFQRYSPTSS